MTAKEFIKKVTEAIEDENEEITFRVYDRKLKIIKLITPDFIESNTQNDGNGLIVDFNVLPLRVESARDFIERDCAELAENLPDEIVEAYKNGAEKVIVYLKEN